MAADLLCFWGNPNIVRVQADMLGKGIARAMETFEKR